MFKSFLGGTLTDTSTCEAAMISRYPPLQVVYGENSEGERSAHLNTKEILNDIGSKVYREAESAFDGRSSQVRVVRSEKQG